MTLEEFETRMTDKQRAAYEALVMEGKSEDADRQAVMSRLAQLAGQVLQGADKKFTGALLGAVRQSFSSPRRTTPEKTIDELAGRLPYPLGLKLRTLLKSAQRREDGEAEPQFPYDVCSVMGVLVRLLALISIRAYATADSRTRDAVVNHRVMETLRAPADGAWLNIVRYLSKFLRGDPHVPLMAKLVEAFGRKAKGVKPAEALEAVVGFRNKLIHGESITPEQVDSAFQRLLTAVMGLSFLADYKLVVRTEGGSYRFDGDVPQLQDNPENVLPDREPCLVCVSDEEDALSLAPLLVFVSSSDGNSRVDIDELFFLNAGSSDRLSYIAYRYPHHMDGKTLGAYEAFRRFMATMPTPPIPKDPRIDYAQLVEYHTRMFVGREEVIDGVELFVKARPQPYGVLKALAGMGKTALMAKLYSLNPPRTKTDDIRGAGNRWVYHFCMSTNGRDDPIIALRSIIAQICDAFGWDRKRYLSASVAELRNRLVELLHMSGEELPAEARLVIAVDALDEGITTGAEDTIPSILPENVPNHVVFLVSYRVGVDKSNTRVATQLSHLNQDFLHVIESSNPLAGLSRANVADFLEHLDGSASDATVDTVWDASRRAADGSVDESNGADPFYLRFVAEGVEQTRFDVSRAETIPASLDEAFDNMWMSLPTDREFLIYRVLCTLAVMREYGDDQFFADLFNIELEEGEVHYAPSDIAELRSKAGKLLVYDNDRYGLFHDRFRVYLVGEQVDPLAASSGTN